MTLIRWRPSQKKTAQVGTGTITGYDVATTYKVTIGNKVISTLGTGGTTATTAAALYALLAACTEPEFTEVTWSYVAASSVITYTSNTAGQPVTVTFAVSGGAGTVSNATTTANTSPNDVNDPLNWLSSAGATGLPVAGDDVLVDLGGVENSMYWNLNALAGLSLNSFTRRESAAGAKIGLPEINRNGTAYPEYRATEFAFRLQGAFAALIEQASSDRAEQVKITTGPTQTTLTIGGKGAGSLGNEATWFRGTHASNVVNVLVGSLAIAPVNFLAATFATLFIRSGVARCGANVTQGVVNNLAGTIELNNTVTTLTQQGGKTTVKGDALNMTTATVMGGTLTYMGTGTIGTLTVGSGATADFSKDNRARTITNKVLLYARSTFNDPAGTTIAAGVSFQTVGCLLKDCNVTYGPSHSYTVAA